MKTNWTLKEKSTGELEAVVDGDVWQKAQKKAFSYYKKNMSIKGFRQGQIPDALLKKQVSKEAIYDRAVNEVANVALFEGIGEHKLELVAQPTLDYKDASDDSITLVFYCTVAPEVKLGQYKELPIKKKAGRVLKADVEKEVERVQDRFADWIVREEKEEAQNGDRVNIDFVGKKDGVAFEGGSGENYPLELGSNTFIPGFEDQLVGVKVGEEKDVNVTFPEDYQAKDLAGQDAVFSVKVNEISYKERPEANDELIKKLKREGVETLEQFKEATKEDLKKQKANQAEEEFNNAILDSITSSSEVDIPQVMIDNEVNRMYNDFARRMEGSGFTIQQYFEAVGQSEEDLKATFVDEATNKVKASLVLDAIVKEENIEVTDEDINKEYEEMSGLYNMEVDQIKRLLPAENLKYDIAQQKALQLIKDSVKK